MLHFNLLPSVARKQVESCPPGVYCFEEEVKSGGAHMAIVIGLEALANSYSKTPNRFVHESIHGNRKCRLYMDIDGATVGATSITKVNQVAADIHDLVIEDLRQYDMVVAPPEVMTGCYPGKFSVHLVWDVWFTTPTHCRGFVERIVERFTAHQGLKIDCAIYKSQKAVGTLRMAYSKKRKINVPLIPVTAHRFSIAAWARTLVTFHEGMAGISGLPPKPEFVPIKLRVPMGPQSIRTLGELSQSEEVLCARYREITLDWLAKSSPSISLMHQNDSKIQIRTYCRRARKIHASNTMFVSTRSNARVVLHCQGTECRCDVPMLYSSSQILTSALPLEIEWSMM